MFGACLGRRTDRPARARAHASSSAPASPASCTAIKLDEAGERDFLVVERGSDVGGTWRDNTYPGAACDVPSQLYSFSFAPNPDWSRSFSPQPEIQAYIQRRRRDVRGARPVPLRHRRRGRRAGTTTPQRLAGAYDAPASSTADVLVSAAGALSDPKLPDIDGIDSFDGRGLPLRAVAPRLRPHRQAGRGDRHRRLGDPDRPRDRRAGRPPRRLPAHRAAGHPAQRPRLHRRRRSSPSSTCPASRRPTAPAIYWARESFVPGVRLGPADRRAGQAGRAAEHPQRASPTRSCARR